MELNAPVWPSAITLDLTLRLVCAAAAGLLLGLDREARGYGAGLRTHGIACFASALLTTVAVGLFFAIGGPNTRVDPMRVIEGTATIAGVIGAAVLFRGDHSIHNLTTAMHLWLVLVIGIAFGAGFYPAALLGTAGAFLLLTVMRTFERGKRFGAHDDGQG